MKIKKIGFKGKILLFAATSAIVTLSTLMTVPYLKAAGEPRDFDSNATIKGGAFSKDELITRINSGDGAHGDLQQIFYSENRGITEAGIRNSADGVVKKDGTVWVGGTQVASGVFSSGRTYMPGSTRDGSLWMRPPSVSFVSSQLDAFVLMDGGTFKFAIIKSCGNPIKVLKVPFPQIFKRVRNDRTGVESDGDTIQSAVKVQPGDPITYSVTVTNQGNGPLNETVVTDSLPAGVELRDNPQNRDLSVNLGTIEGGGGRKNIKILAKVTSKKDKECINNIAKFTSKEGFEGEDNAFICVEIPPKPKNIINLKLIKFNDKNGNGKQDPGEETLPGFTFKVNDSTTKTTDQKGEAFFPEIKCGATKIEEINIPPEWTPTFLNPFTINLDCDKDSTIALGNKQAPPVPPIPPQPPVPPTPPTPPQPPVQPQVIPSITKGAVPSALPAAGPESAFGFVFGGLSIGWVGRNYLKSKKAIKDSIKK